MQAEDVLGRLVWAGGLEHQVLFNLLHLCGTGSKEVCACAL